MIATRPELFGFAGIDLVYVLSQRALAEADNTRCALTVIRLYDELADDAPILRSFSRRGLCGILFYLFVQSASSSPEKSK